MQDIWEPLPASMCFPVSDCRSESPLADLVSRRTNKPASKPSSPVSLFPSSYSTQLPRRWQVSPGVWTDGQSTLYSPALPEVQKLLADARESLTIPEPSSDLILTLAALEVFYRPSDPAHWMFWSDDKKSYTADVVTKIALHNPPMIVSPVAWNGKPEYLAILAMHHGSSWKQIYETKEWYTILCPPKPTTPPRSLNLRKRRVLPGAFREPSKSPGLEDDMDDLIPVRGARNSRASTPARISVEQPQTKAQGSQANYKRKQRSSSLDVSETPSILPMNMTEPPEEGLTPLSEIIDLSPEPTAIPTRRKRKVVSPSRYPEPLSGSKALLEASLLLAPVQMDVVQPAVTHTHGRTRSTSTDSSSTLTVVEDLTGSRSSSVASAVTIIGSGNTSPLKRKADAIEEEVLEEGATATGAEAEEDDEDSQTRSARPKRRAKGRAAANKVPVRRRARKA